MPVCPNCHEHNPEVGAACPRCDGFYYVPDQAINDADKDPMIGRIAADKYVVLSLINEGGMGAVYRALQLPVEREVALKVLRTELKDSDQAGDRFIREARAVSRLNHPNIITLYDFGFDTARHPYMVMEYAPGASLAKWIRQDDVTIERIIHVIHQILSALTEAHQRGIVHRDLKPDNMIVTQTGSDPDYIKLLDFGIARLINEGSTRSLTREGEVFGTPHYMAPEQAQGSKEVGPPADVYAVGIMMYEMLTGDCPFDAQTPLAVLFMHLNDEIPAVVYRPNVVPLEGLERILRIATSKDPKERFQDAGEMLTALTELVATMGSGLTSLAHMQDLTGEALVPGRIPRMTPMPDPDPTPIGHQTPFPATLPDISRVNVRVDDPDPSVIFETEQKHAKNRKIVMFALGIIVLLGMIGTVIAVTSTDNSVANEKPDEVVEVTEPTEVEEPTETEIAIKENNDAVKDDNAVANVDLEPDETEPIEPIEVEPEIVEEPEEKPVKKKVTKKIRKKTTPKEKTVETVSEKPKEKPVEKKTTKKKDGPKKFSIPVKKFDAK